MSQAVRFQEILRRLAIIDEGFVEGHAGLGLGLPASRLLDPKTAALVRVGALVAIGSPGVCLEWAPPGRSPRAPPRRDYRRAAGDRSGRRTRLGQCGRPPRDSRPRA